MIAASSDIGDFFGDVGQSVLDELRKAGNDAVTHIREDLATAAAQLAAGVGTAAGGVIAPAAKPIVIPLSSKQLGYLAVVLVLLLLGAGYLVTRARR